MREWSVSEQASVTKRQNVVMALSGVWNADVLDVLGARERNEALGAVTDYLLMGAPVCTGQTVLELFGRHLHAAPVPPGERAPVPVPASLEQVILRCLETDPQRRYPSAIALLAELTATSDAGSWSEDDARAWWRARGDTLMAGLRAEQSARAADDDATGPSA